MTTHRPNGVRRGRLLAAAIVSLGLVAGACSKKDETTTTPTETTTVDTGVTTETTTAETTPTTEAMKDPVAGGTVIVSGEAEVANPWTPAAMQCDSYCQQRARTFYDPLVAYNEDLEVTGVLLESWTNNADYTEWTFTVRSGISFTDGTPLNAAAVVKNLQATGTGLLISAAVTDIGKNPDGSLAIEATGDMTFTVKTGKNGDLSQPRPWPNLPAAFAGQLGFVASPTWLDAVAANTGDATKPIGTGPFIVESYAPRDKLVVKRNP
ncbi:MAG: ABC transporter substrate-binding protein, partial [Ilumatobacteraceae bacterium]